MFTWNVDPNLANGPFPVRIYGLFLAVAIVSAFLLFRWQLMREGHPEATAGWFLAHGLVGVVTGARLVHCFVYDLQRTLADPWVVIRPWEGGLSSHGALAGLLLIVVVFGRRHQLRFSDLADWLSLGAALSVVLVRLGNFFNSEIVGRVTGGPWGVRFVRWDGPGALPRHPVQLYEATLGAGIFVVLAWIDRRQRKTRRPGLPASLFLASYFGIRLLLEVFKEPEGLPASSLVTLGQILSIAPAAVGAMWLVAVLRRGTQVRE